MSSFFESQTFDSSIFNSSWSTINSNPDTANTSNWSILTSPPKQLKREFIENHEVPLDKLYSELPFYLWDQLIWPKLDLETLLETYKALVEQNKTENLKNCDSSNLHQARLQRQYIPNSIKHSSIEEITKSLQKQALELKNSKKIKSNNNNHTPPKRRKLAVKPKIQKVTKYEACVQQIQEIIVEKILNLLNLNPKNYPILKNVLKIFLLEAPKRLSVVYLANLKVIIPDSWKDPVVGHDLRNYVKEMSSDFRVLYTIACFTLKVLYSFSTEEVRVRIADPVLGLMVTMPDSIRQTYLQNDDGWDEEYWLEDASFEDKTFWKFIKNKPEVDTERLIANGMCSKMDLASAIYHCPTKTVQMYGLQNIQAFHHFEENYEVDWRFVGYSIMSSNSPSEPAQNLTLSLYDINDKRVRSSQVEDNPNSSEGLGYAKMIQELHFCARVQNLVLKQFQMSQTKASELFDSLPILNKIITSQATYHRCQLLPAQTSFPETRKQYQLRLQESERNKLRTASF